MQDQRLEWLRSKMDHLFEQKAQLEAQGQDLNAKIQAGREFRNPRICEKLIEAYGIKQYGTNFDKKQCVPEGSSRKSESYYDSKTFDRRKHHPHSHHRNKIDHSSAR